MKLSCKIATQRVWSWTYDEAGLPKGKMHVRQKGYKDKLEGRLFSVNLNFAGTMFEVVQLVIKDDTSMQIIRDRREYLHEKGFL